MSSNAWPILILTNAGAKDFLPARINLGDVIELRREPSRSSKLETVAAYHQGAKVGYLAREKQGLWNSMRGRPHRVVVTGKLSDDAGDLVGLDVEIRPVEKSHHPTSPAAPQASGTPLASLLTARSLSRLVPGLAALLVIIALGSQVLPDGIDLRELVSKLCCGLSDQSAPAAKGPLSPPADLVHDIRDEYQKSARVGDHLPSRLSSSYSRATGETAFSDSSAAGGDEESSYSRQTGELWRKSQQVAAWRLAAKQDLQAEQLAAERVAKEESEKSLALREMNDRELIHHRQQMTAWKTNDFDLRQQAAELRRKSQEAEAHRLLSHQQRAERRAAEQDQNERKIALPETSDGQSHSLERANPQVVAESAAGRALQASEWLDCKGDDYEKSVAACTALIDSGQLNDADRSLALANRGWALNGLAQYDKAVSDYTESLRLASDHNAWAYFNRALAYIYQDRFDKAAADLSQALLVDPSYVEARASRGFAYKHLGNLNEALSDLSSAIEANPRYAYAYAVRGLTFLDQGALDQATRDFDMAISLDGSVAWNYTFRGLAHLQSNNDGAALADLEKALAMTPDDIEANTFLGMLREKKGETEAAKAAFHRALQTQAHFAGARKAQQTALDRLLVLEAD